ncbi:hypothetical protein V6Z11_A12G138700 [Gossypium hirsutum]
MQVLVASLSAAIEKDTSTGSFNDSIHEEI